MNFIKITSMAALASIAVSCGNKDQIKPYNEGIHIIPVPAELTVTDPEGTFTLKNSTAIYADADFSVAADLFAVRVKNSTGFNLSVKEGAAGANSIELVKDQSITASEGYTLTSTADRVRIAASTPAGAFYGIQTLLQLLPAEIVSPSKVSHIAWCIPLVSIKDEPRFSYRGMHLDVSRHFFDVDVVKKQLDVMAMFKMNRFHWHLTDDQGWRIEIKKYPLLTEIGSKRIGGDGKEYGGFYTQEQIKEVVAYAAERQIEVIPEIELPGHAMAAISAYPEFSCTGGPFTPRIIWGVEDDVFCVGNEKTLEFLEDVLTEVVGLFPGQYFHIGADECPKARWEKCPKCQALARSLDLKPKDGHTVEEQLQSYTVKRMAKLLASYDKKLIGWDEILEGGLAPGAIIMSWRDPEFAIEAASQDHGVIMTPGGFGMYVNFSQGAYQVEPVNIGGLSTVEMVYAYDPIPEGLPADKHQYILGAQTNLWTEYIHTPDIVEYMLYPRVIAISEVDWSPKDKRNWEDFEQRLNNSFVRLDLMGVNYHIPMPEGTLVQKVVFTGESIEVPFSNSRNLDMRYTLDGTEPTLSSSLYGKPLVVTPQVKEIKIATFLATGKRSTIRTIEVSKENLSAASEPTADPTVEGVKLPAGLKPGVGSKVRRAPGLFMSKDDYAKAQFGPTQIVSDIFGDKAIKYDMKKPELAIYQGWIDLPESGVYSIGSDMGEVWIDGELLIDTHEKMYRNLENITQKALEAGKHSYKIVFNNRIIDGWPNSWHNVGFVYWLPSQGLEFVFDDFHRMKPEQLSY